MYPPVQTEEEIWYYLQVFLVSTVITYITCVLSLHLLWDTSVLQNLTLRKKVTVIVCIPSYVHAVIASALATYALYSEKGLHNDYVWGQSTVASTACAITSGYMIGDLLIMVTYWRHVFDWGYLIHHLTSAAAFLFVCVVGSYRFFAMMRLLAEYSTVFVNNRAILHDLGWQGGQVYFYNGLFMVASFTFARIVPFPVYLYCLYSVLGTEAFDKSGHGRHIVCLSTIFLDTLNFLWYHKMLKGAVKVWKAQKGDASSIENRSKTVKQG